MKILILVSVITWSFYGGYQNTPSAQVVGSPKDAAIIIFQERENSISVEPDQKKWTLYEIDFKTSIIKEIAIPKIIFKNDD